MQGIPFIPCSFLPPCITDTVPCAWNNIPHFSSSGWLLFFKAHLNFTSSSYTWGLLSHAGLKAPPLCPIVSCIYLMIVSKIYLLASISCSKFLFLCLPLLGCMGAGIVFFISVYITSSPSPDTQTVLSKYLLSGWMDTAQSFPSMLGLEP